jgi:RES domain-containing protein
MRLYRIIKTKHAHDLTGEGAKLNGGRWNHTGIPCIYLAESRALSLLEYAAHASMETLPSALSFTTLEVPDHSIRQLSLKELPSGWLHQPHSKASQDIGSALLTKNDHLLLKLPSVLIEQEFNFVLNPLHPLISAVTIAEIAKFKGLRTID